MLRSRRSRREEPLGRRTCRIPSSSADDAVDPSTRQRARRLRRARAARRARHARRPPSGWRSCSTTCSRCRSRRSPRSSDRSAEATRQLASRARRRVQGAAVTDTDVGRQRQVVDAFFAAARGGDFGGLVALLDPDVVLRSDGGTARPAQHRVRPRRRRGRRACHHVLVARRHAAAGARQRGCRRRRRRPRHAVLRHGLHGGRRQGGVDRRAGRSGSAQGPRSVGAGRQRRVSDLLAQNGRHRPRSPTRAELPITARHDDLLRGDPRPPGRHRRRRDRIGQEHAAPQAVPRARAAASTA